MNLIKRIKYLWNLSKQGLPYEEQVRLHEKILGLQPLVEQPKKMAQIIKRKSSDSLEDEVKKILEDDN